MRVFELIRRVRVIALGGEVFFVWGRFCLWFEVGFGVCGGVSGCLGGGLVLRGGWVGFWGLGFGVLGLFRE